MFRGGHQGVLRDRSGWALERRDQAGDPHALDELDTDTIDAKYIYEQALAGNVFYIGALGSTRTHAKRVDRLTAKGFTPAQIARIHGPVGLDIGAAGPAEIALSIMAQMTAVLRGKAP